MSQYCMPNFEKFVRLALHHAACSPQIQLHGSGVTMKVETRLVACPSAWEAKNVTPCNLLRDDSTTRDQEMPAGSKSS